MSNGLFTVSAELQCGSGVFADMLDAGRILHAAHQTNLGGRIDTFLYTTGVTSLRYGELAVPQVVEHETAVPLCFEVCDVSPDEVAVAGFCTLTGPQNRDFIARIADEYHQSLQPDEELLEGAIIPTILSNPRIEEDASVSVDAQMVINTWTRVGRTIPANGLAPPTSSLVPTSEDFFEISQFSADPSLSLAMNVDYIRGLIERLQQASAEQLGTA